RVLDGASSTELVTQVVAGQVLEHVHRLALLVPVAEVDRADCCCELDRSGVELLVALADAHECAAHADAHRVLLFRDRVADLLDAAEKELVGEPLVLLVFGQLVYESVAATAADGVFARHPAPRDLERDGGLGEGRTARAEHVAEHSWPRAVDLLFDLIACELFWVVDEQTDDLCVVVAFVPKFEREVAVAPNLFRNRTEFGEADSETGQPACAVA